MPNESPPTAPPSWPRFLVRECRGGHAHDSYTAQDGPHVHLPSYITVRLDPESQLRVVAVPPWMVRLGRISERAIRERFRGGRWRGTYQQRHWDRPGILRGVVVGREVRA